MAEIGEHSSDLRIGAFFGALMGSLRASRLSISPKDETEAAQFVAAYMECWGLDTKQIDTIEFVASLRPYLRSLFAKSETEVAKFDAAFEAAAKVLKPKRNQSVGYFFCLARVLLRKSVHIFLLAILVLFLIYLIRPVTTPPTEAKKTRREVEAQFSLPAQPEALANPISSSQGEANIAAIRILRAFGPTKKASLWEISSRLTSGRNGDFIVMHDTDSRQEPIFSPDGTRIWTNSRVWDSQNGAELAHCNCVARSPDGRRIGKVLGDNTLQILDAENGVPLREPLRDDDVVSRAVFSPEGRRVIITSGSNYARVWDIESGKLLVNIHHEDIIIRAAFSPDGRRIVTASADKTAQVWDADSGILVGTPLRHEGAVLSAAFSPDGRRIVTASADKTAQVWDAPSGMRIGTLLGHEGAVLSAAFSPDGRRVVTASVDKTARVWDPDSGMSMGGLPPQKAPVESAAFSPDGASIVTASSMGTLRLWDAATFAPARLDRRLPKTPVEMFKLLLRLTDNSADKLLSTDDKTLSELTKSLLLIDGPGKQAQAEVLDEAIKTAQVTISAQDLEQQAVTPYKASSAFVTPWWLFGLVVGLPIIVIGFGIASVPRWKRAYLRNILETDQPVALHRFAASEEAAASIRAMRRNLSIASRLLIRREHVSGNDLDAEATAEATAKNVGHFSPVFARRKVTSDTLFLITLGSAIDAEGERMDWMAAEVEKMCGTPEAVERWYLEPRANSVYRKLTEPPLKLEELARRLPNHRLVFFGTGDGFLAPGDLRLWPWAETLSTWEKRTWATPVHPDNWGMREARVARLFQRVPHYASSEGLRNLAADFLNHRPKNGRVASWRVDPLRWTMQATHKKREVWFEINSELSKFLDSGALDWLRATAIYPSLRLDIALYLGLKLKDARGRVLFTEVRAAQLCQLPWFRSGMMPDWVRAHLISEIGTSRRREILALLGELYGQADSNIVNKGIEQTVIKLPVAVAGTPISPDQPRLSLASGDAIFLDLLEKENTAAFEAPLKLQDLIKRGKMNKGHLVSFTHEQYRKLVIITSYAAVGVWLFPKPWDGPWVTGAWLPFFILLICVLLVVVSYEAREALKRWL